MIIQILLEITLTQFQFVAPSAEEFEIFKRQMKVRLDEGQGESMYEIGIGGEWGILRADP